MLLTYHAPFLFETNCKDSVDFGDLSDEDYKERPGSDDEAVGATSSWSRDQLLKRPMGGCLEPKEDEED